MYFCFRRFHNKGVYVKMGLRKMVSRRTWRDFHKEVRLEVDNKVIDLPPVEGIIILNILRWEPTLMHCRHMVFFLSLSTAISWKKILYAFCTGCICCIWGLFIIEWGGMSSILLDGKVLVLPVISSLPAKFIKDQKHRVATKNMPTVCRSMLYILLKVRTHITTTFGLTSACFMFAGCVFYV